MVSVRKQNCQPHQVMCGPKEAFFQREIGHDQRKLFWGSAVEEREEQIIHVQPGFMGAL